MARRPKYVTDPQTFNKEFERVVKLRDELKKAKEEVEALIGKLSDSTDLPEEVEANIENLKSELSTLQASYTTTSTYIKEIKDYKDNFDVVKQSIDTELETAEKQNKTLTEYISDATDLKTKLEEEKTRSTELLDDARKTLKLITDGSLSTVFIERSNQRKTARRWWALAVIIYFGIFVAALNHIINNVANTNGSTGTIASWSIRLAVSAPFAYFLYFVIKQYSHERDLEEKYAFKALISQTISNNTKLLKDEFSEYAQKDTKMYEKILDFTISSLKAVYREPFKESSIRSKLKFNPKNTDIAAEVEQSETV